MALRTFPVRTISAATAHHTSQPKGILVLLGQRRLHPRRLRRVRGRLLVPSFPRPGCLQDPCEEHLASPRVVTGKEEVVEVLDEGAVDLLGGVRHQGLRPGPLSPSRHGLLVLLLRLRGHRRRLQVAHEVGEGLAPSALEPPEALGSPPSRSPRRRLQRGAASGSAALLA